MRKIFLIALFALCAIEGFSQRYTPFQGWGFSARRLKADSVSIVPSDTVINKAPNSVAIFGGRVYFHNGTRWQDISYDLPINVRDSLSATYPLLYNSSTGVFSADTGRAATNLATGGSLNKVKDSLAAAIVFRLLISDTTSMLSPYLRKADTASLSSRINLKLNISDTSSMLSPYLRKVDTASLSNRIDLKLNLSDSSLYASRGRLYKVTDSLGGIISSVTPDSSVYSTKAWRQKGIDSVQANLTAGLALKLNLSDSSLYASRGRLYKVADSLGSVISSASADSLVFSTKAYRQKGVDSVQANLLAGLALKLNITDTSSMLSPYYRTALANATIVQRITDSLRALVRLRASGSGGIDVQNSIGTSVANFGSGGTTNISLNGATNVNARLSVTDSIVGVNQRLSGGLTVNGVTNLNSDLNAQSITSTAPNNGNGFLIKNVSSQNIFNAYADGSSNGQFLFANSSGTTKAQINTASSQFILNLDQNSAVVPALNIQSSQRASIGLGTTLSFNNGFIIGRDIGNNGTNDFYITNLATGVINMQINSSGGTTFSGALTANGKATFTDSIVGVNQRLSGILDIVGSARAAEFRANGNGSNFISRETSGGIQANYIAYQNSSSTERAFVGYGSSSVEHFSVYNGRNANLDFYTNASLKLRITPSKVEVTDSLITTTQRVSGALTATAQGNNITIGVDSSVTSTSYTLVLGDAGYLKRCNNASAITITVPTNASVAFPIGTTIYFSQQGAGKVSLSPASGVTLNSSFGLVGTLAQHSVIGIVKVNTNVWIVIGERG